MLGSHFEVLMSTKIHQLSILGKKGLQNRARILSLRDSAWGKQKGTDMALEDKFSAEIIDHF